VLEPTAAHSTPSLDPACLSWVLVYPQEWSGTQTWWRPWSYRTYCCARCRQSMVQKRGRSHGVLMPGKIIRYAFEIDCMYLVFSHLLLLTPTLCFHSIFLKSKSRKMPFVFLLSSLFSPFLESFDLFLGFGSKCQ
jgi:hypothetical protein